MVDGDWQVTASANQRGAGAEIVETSCQGKGRHGIAICIGNSVQQGWLQR